MKKTKLKVSICLIVVVNLFMSSYLRHEFDEKDVVLSLDQAYPVKQIEYSVGKLPVESYVIEYAHREKNQEVVFAKGYYNGFSNEELIEGRQITFGDYKSVVISKDIASRLYKTYDCLGFDYNYKGINYTIVGVIDGGHKIILTLPENFVEREGYRTILKVKLEKVLESQLSLIRTILRVDGINTNSTLVNQWFIKSFRNFAILLLMTMLILEIIRRLQLIIGWAKQCMVDRNKEKITFVVSEYLKDHGVEFREAMVHSVLSLVMIKVVCFVGKDIDIPTYLLPQDPTRISQWVAGFRQLKLGLDYQLLFGVQTIVVKTGVLLVLDIVLMGGIVLGEKLVMRK